MTPEMENYSDPAPREKTRGLIALCSQGLPGIVTEDGLQATRLGHMAYVGVNLINGQPWCSRNPTFIGTFQEFLASGKTFEEWRKR